MPGRPTSEAHEIVEHILGETGAALMSGDFQRMMTCFELPYEIGTFAGQRTVASEAEMRTTFDRIRAHYEARNVTDLVRRCMEAEFHDPVTIESTHETRVMSGAVQVQETYTVYSRQRLIDGRWKVGWSQYAITDVQAHIAVLSGALPGSAGEGR